MYLVFTCCLVAIFVAWLESIGAYKHGLRTGFIIITLLSALRYDYGCDYLGYIDDFNEAVKYDISDYIRFGEDVKESGWFLIMKLFEPFGVYAFFAFLAIISSCIYYNFIKENVHVNDYWLAFSIYLLNFDLFVLQQSMMRQALVISIFIWGFRYIKKINVLLYIDNNLNIRYRKTKVKSITILIIKMFLLLTVCINIHQSSIVLIPASLFAFIPMQNGKFLSAIFFVTFCLLWLSSRFITPMFNQLMAVEEFAYYGEKYATDEGAQFGIRQLFCFLPFFFSLYYLCGKNTQISNRVLVVMSMFGVLILPFASILQLISRMTYYFDAFAIAAYPIVYRNINNKTCRNAFVALFLLIYIYVWFDKSMNPIWGGKFIEYQTLFTHL